MMILLFDPDPIHSANINDAERPGVVVELDQETASLKALSRKPP
jgi:hypothetical protein